VKHWPQKLQRFGENKTGMVCRAGLSVEPRVCALDNRTLLRDYTFGHARQLESVLIDHLSGCVSGLSCCPAPTQSTSVVAQFLTIQAVSRKCSIGHTLDISFENWTSSFRT
jgi:hypothetical protein